MKKSIFPLLLFCFFIYSCQTQDDSFDKNEVISREIPINIESLDFSNGVPMGNYNDVATIKESIKLLMLDFKGIHDDNGLVNSVIFHIIKDGTQLYLVGYTTLDFDNNVIKSERIVKSIGPIPPSLDAASCPTGYQDLGKCSNFNNVEDCIADKISSFLGSNLSSPGDCANVQVQVGLGNTRVCGKTC